MYFLAFIFKRLPCFALNDILLQDIQKTPALCLKISHIQPYYKLLFCSESASNVTFKAEVEAQHVSKYMEYYVSYIIGIKATFILRMKSLKKSG